MSGKRSGQILYLAGSTSSHNSPGGSLSTRFQKLAQARSSGITVVNSTSSIETRSGTGLGLGRNTGSRPSGPGQRIVALHSNSSSNHNNTAAAGGSAGPNRKGGKRADSAGLGPGLHTAGGLARAMQERGTGVTDEFLLAPKLHLTPAGEGSGRGGGAVRRRGRGGATGPGAGPSNQASRHKSMVLGHRPTRQQKQNGGVSQQQPPPPSAPQQQQQPGRGPAQAAKPKQGGGPKGPKGAKNANGATGAKPAAPAGTKPKGKNKKGGAAAAAAAAASEKGKDKSKPNADKLDSELSDYMMKSEHTAASLLDNDLDMYMADRPEDNVW